MVARGVERGNVTEMLLSLQHWFTNARGRSDIIKTDYILFLGRENIFTQDKMRRRDDDEKTKNVM